MKLKSLNYFSQSIAEEAKTNGYAYLKDLTAAHMEHDPVALYDAMSDLSEIKYPSYLSGSFFSRLHKRGKAKNSGLLDGVVRASMQVFADPGAEFVHIVEWLDTLKTIDSKNPGKDSLHDTALLYFFDVVDYRDSEIHDRLFKMIEEHVTDPVAQVGLRGQLKLNLVDLAFYGKHPMLAHHLVMKTEDGLQEYALHLQDYHTPRNVLELDYRTYPYAHLLRGKTDEKVIDLLDALDSKTMVPKLNAIIKESGIYGDEDSDSKQTVQATYAKLKPKMDMVFEAQYMKCPPTREFIVKSCACGFIQDPQFNAVAQNVFETDETYKTIDEKYQPAYECMLKISSPGGHKPSFNETLFKQMIQTVLDAGVQKNTLQACFNREGCKKFIADHFHDSLPVFVALRDSGLMDLAHKDKRGWSAYSHMGKDGLQRLSAMTNAEHARDALKDILAEMKLAPKGP